MFAIRYAPGAFLGGLKGGIAHQNLKTSPTLTLELQRQGWQGDPTRESGARAAYWHFRAVASFFWQLPHAPISQTKMVAIFKPATPAATYAFPVDPQRQISN